MSLRFVGYARVSTDKQTDNTSFENQKRVIEEYVQGKGGILLEMYQETFTGKEDHRPILDKAIQDCKDLNARLVVSKLDRLSRRMNFIINFQERYDVEFVVVEFPESYSKHMLFIFSLFAEMERDMISERTKEALRAKMAAGTYNPTGENLRGVKRNPLPGREKNMEKTRKFRHHTFMEMERICKEYHQKFQAYPSMNTMIDKLNERHNRTCRGKEWNQIHLQNFLQKGKKTGEIKQYNIQLSNYQQLNNHYVKSVPEEKAEDKEVKEDEESEKEEEEEENGSEDEESEEESEEEESEEESEEEENEGEESTEEEEEESEEEEEEESEEEESEEKPAFRFITVKTF